MLSWNSSILATSCEELTHWKRLWCWEGLGAGGKGDNRGWDGWMASPTWWTRVWVNSGSWWWTGRPGVLQFMGWQRVGHDWATDLIWSELLTYWGNETFLVLLIWMENAASKTQLTKCRNKRERAFIHGPVYWRKKSSALLQISMDSSRDLLSTHWPQHIQENLFPWIHRIARDNFLKWKYSWFTMLC